MRDGPPADVIEIRGLRVLGSHGALPGEQDRAQPFELDLEVEVDAAAAARTDDRADAVDYGRLLAIAAGVVRGEPRHLLETLAEEIAAALLAVPGVEGATVTVRKLRPPVPEHVASAGVRVSRRRAADTGAGEPGRASASTAHSRDPESVARPGTEAGHPRIAYLGLGSNLGDRRRYLRQAVEELRRLVDPDLAVSPVYETEPVGGPPGQGRYLNCVVRLWTDLPPRALLQVAGGLETAAGRVRTVPDGPRTLDVDVLLVEGTEVREPDLVVPHPRLRERAFVLAPLEDLEPDLVPAGWRAALGGDDVVDGAVRLVGTLFDS